MSETVKDTTRTPLNIAEVRERLRQKQGKAYWRSLDEIADTHEFREFLHKEFPRQAAPLEGSIDRRDFIKLLGASLALAGLSSCALPPTREEIVPYVRAPEEIIPGKPLFFATALTHGGYARGALVESNMGRPTKVEGNVDHPISLGATDVYMQASVLTLYDPDRAQGVLLGGAEGVWDDFVARMGETLGGLGTGAGLRILTENVTSPTMAAQMDALLSRFPEARWHQYDPVHSDYVREGAVMAFGEDARALYRLGNADVILSLDANFLGEGPGMLRYTRDFARARRVLTAEDSMNRLYVAESTPSITGATADHRLPLRPSEIEALARALAQQLGVSVSGSLPPEGVPSAWLQAVLSDLQETAGRSLVIAGDEQPPIVHALAHAMNAALGNVGETVIYIDPPELLSVDQSASLRDLTQAMAAGEVEMLVVIGGNPVYTAPADVGFAAALERVPESVHLSLYPDETSLLCTWHLPQTHELETWSDARAVDGTASIMQPLIAPFYGGHSVHELLAVLNGEPATSYDVVRNYWQEQVAAAGGDFDDFWRTTLYRGVVEGSATSPKQVTANTDFSDAAVPAAAQEGALEVLFRPDPSVHGGQYANNGWLQELPKPFTALTWDNAAIISPRTAELYGLSIGDVVLLSYGEHSVPAPVWILPGQAEGTVTAHLGYGRENAGRIGNGTGFNAYRVRTLDAPWSGAGLELAPTGEDYTLASTQVHHTLEGDRAIVRPGTLAEFKAHPEHPEFVHPVEHHESDLYPDYVYETYAWGMVIDMNVCTGCNACVVACQAENNIPIVGKDQVAVGREMHWIRVDSYYAGELDDPEYYFQPMLCQHCEKAPCEPVCPVGATIHDHEGLNVMVYNRCVGTRYCSNNCPYKVRRFNFLQYAELEENALTMVQNPNVTVRSRGVMEKCTYCTQRIKRGQIQADIEERGLVDGEIVTACQAACPAEAIVFGDINDQTTAVVHAKASPLNYSVLEELNTVPRTSYITPLKNPHPALASVDPLTGGH